MNDIIVDITEVVNRQQKASKYNIRLTVLIVGVVVLLAVAAGILMPSLAPSIPVFADLAAILPPWPVFAIIAGVTGVISVFIYNLPSSRDRKFNEPFIENITRELSNKGYVFDDDKKKTNLDPWLSSLSKYMHGGGVKLKPNMASGRKARTIKFLKNNIPVLLSAERMGTRGSVLLHIVEVDGTGALLFNQIDDDDFGDPMQQVPVQQQYQPAQYPSQPVQPVVSEPVYQSTPPQVIPSIPVPQTIIPITPPPSFAPIPPNSPGITPPPVIK